MKSRIHRNFPLYRIYENGVVERMFDGPRGVKAGDIINGRVLSSGYRQHKLISSDGSKKLVRTNRLVCEAFYGNPPSEKHHAAHRDGNKLNNSAENLYWATPRQNKRDCIRHGTQPKGESVCNQHGPAKLTKEKVLHIREKYNGKRGQIAAMAREYGVGTTAIKNVLNYVTWKHVGRSALDRMQAQ